MNRFAHPPRRSAGRRLSHGREPVAPMGLAGGAPAPRARVQLPLGGEPARVRPHRDRATRRSPRRGSTRPARRSGSARAGRPGRRARPLAAGANGRLRVSVPAELRRRSRRRRRSRSGDRAFRVRLGSRGYPGARLMVPPRRHLRARALAPLAALTLAACGCGDGGGSSTVAPPKPTKSLLAAWHALERAPCPAPYLAIDQKTSYSRAELRQAEKGRFSIKGHPTTLEPSIDWAMDPYDSKSFRGVLASLKWIDPVIYASRHGDRQALAQARDIALDWVAHNPRHHPPTDKSWENKIIGDRAPYLAYITRAAACQHMLSSRAGPDPDRVAAPARARADGEQALRALEPRPVHGLRARGAGQGGGLPLEGA